MDTTGTNDVTAQMQTFLAGPAGVLCLNPGAVYRITAQIHLANWSGRTLEGRGVTLKKTTRGNAPVLLIDGGGSDIAIRDLRVTGVNPRPGKWEYAYEHEHCVSLGGTQRVELDRLTCINVGGDGLYLGGGAGRWADTVWVHDSTFDGIGRMGVALTDGISNLTYERNVLRNIGYYAMDVEPNGVQVGGRLAGAEHFRLINNALGPKPFGDYPADSTQADGFAFVTTGASGGGACSDGTVTGNTVTDPNPLYAAFRWNTFLACSPLVVSGNTNQVKH